MSKFCMKLCDYGQKACGSGCDWISRASVGMGLRWAVEGDVGKQANGVSKAKLG